MNHHKENLVCMWKGHFMLYCVWIFLSAWFNHRKETQWCFWYGFQSIRWQKEHYFFGGTSPTPHSVVWPHFSSPVQGPAEKEYEETGQRTEVAWICRKSIPLHLTCTARDFFQRTKEPTVSCKCDQTHMWRLPVLGKYHHNSLMFHCQIKWKVYVVKKAQKNFTLKYISVCYIHFLQKSEPLHTRVGK